MELDVFIIANWLISFFVKVGQSLEFVSKIVKAPVRTASLSKGVETIRNSSSKDIKCVLAYCLYFRF